MADRIIRKNRKFEFVLDEVRRWELRMAEDGDVEIARFDSDGDYVDSPMTIDLTTGVPVFATGGAIDARSVASDVVPTIDRSDRFIELLASASGAKAILTDVAGADAVAVGQEVTFFLTARSGGSYTLALSTGTLTFDAALEAAKVVRTTLGWNVVSLNGATVV